MKPTILLAVHMARITDRRHCVSQKSDGPDEMNYRSIMCFCVACCLTGGLAKGQHATGGTEQPRPTLQQLKLEGIHRSKYVQRHSQTVPATTKTPQPNLKAFQKDIRPVLIQACVQCHGPETQEGNIRIDTLDADLLHGKDVEWWLEVQAVLSNGEMPPTEAGEFNDEDRAKVVDWLSNEIQLASTFRRATGGHTSFRRMTRYEYNYAMQDILGLPFDFAKDLPPDAHSEDGFQNSSEILHMSVAQLETYRQLARKALLRAIVQGPQPPVVHWQICMKEAADREWQDRAKQVQDLKEKLKDDPVKQKQEVDNLLASFKQNYDRTYYRELSSGDTARANWSYGGAKYAFAPIETQPDIPETFDHVAVIPSGRNQYLTVELGDQIPNEGNMRVRIRASRSTTEDNRIPSLQLHFGFQASNEGKAVMQVSAGDTPIEATSDAPQFYEWNVPLGEIYPRNSFRNLATMGGLPSPSEYIRFINSSAPQGEHGDIQIDYVEVTAPVFDEWPPQSHTNIFIDSAIRTDETAYAKQVLNAFMQKAWRRTIGEEDLAKKLDLFHIMRKECDSLEEAMVEVLAVVLSSPNFLYVTNEALEPVAARTDGNDALAATTPPEASGISAAATGSLVSSQPQLQHRLSQFELATRLSMFLWCSIPDDELLRLAQNGELNRTDVLTVQVKRMLADARSKRFAGHFVHQWLDMQLLDFLALNKQLDIPLKEAMQQEPIEFFHEVLRNDNSVLDFIHADYTMANERLALHYGLPDVRGNHFRPVQLDASHQRGGLLTQAGLLAMNSNGTDSHPLKRGVWLLESLLNDPPPPPPPAVPEIDLADPEIAKMTLKERIEDHRNHAACISCHAKIDPWGIAFENYDALGRWRNQINGKPVDASSLLFNNQPLDGMDGLKRFLLKNRQDQFVRSMVHKISTYALGRPLTFSDRASIDNIAADVRQQGDGLATMIQSIVTSELFQTTRSVQ